MGDGTTCRTDGPRGTTAPGRGRAPLCAGPWLPAILGCALALAACEASPGNGDPGPADVPAEAAPDLPGDLPADPGADAADDAPRDVPAGDPGTPDAPVDVPVADVPPVGPPDTPPPPPLTAEEIGFEDVTPPWGGSVVYFNTWSSDGSPDAIWMIDPDDPSHRAVRLRASRVWAFGVGPDGTVAFSCADPLKDVHYPDLVNWYDVVQYTFLVRPGEEPMQVSFGRVNDECHVFSPDGGTLFLCRRANFWRNGDEFHNDPYRVARLDIASRKDEFLTPLVPLVEDFAPALRDDGTLLYTRVYDDTREVALWSMNADGTGAAVALENAHRAVTSADGKTAWFRKSGDAYLWRADSHQLGAATKAVGSNGRAFGGVAPSPDGSRLAYELYDGSANCSDLMVAPSDGSGAPSVLVDCRDDGLNVAGVRWVALPGTIPEPVPEPVPEASEPVPETAGDPAATPDVPDAPVLPDLPDAPDAGGDGPDAGAG